MYTTANTQSMIHVIHACCAYMILWQSNQARSNIEVDSACMWCTETRVIIFDWYKVCRSVDNF